MATKVYWITLRALLARVNRYIGKWSGQLSENLTDSQMEAVNAVYAQNQAALAALPAHDIES
jgi:hypothetical protein